MLVLNLYPINAPTHFNLSLVKDSTVTNDGRSGFVSALLPMIPRYGMDTTGTHHGYNKNIDLTKRRKEKKKKRK